MHWLDQKGIDYQEVDVEADTAAEAELLRLTNGEFTVPVTTIGNETILGFDRPAVLAALKKPKV
jgi:glutaredoxin